MSGCIGAIVPTYWEFRGGELPEFNGTQKRISPRLMFAKIPYRLFYDIRLANYGAAAVACASVLPHGSDACAARGHFVRFCFRRRALLCRIMRFFLCPGAQSRARRTRGERNLGFCALSCLLRFFFWFGHACVIFLTAACFFRASA